MDGLAGMTKEKARRDRMIGTAIKEHGYTQMEVARHLKLHYSTISRLMKVNRKGSSPLIAIDTRLTTTQQIFRSLNTTWAWDRRAFCETLL